VPRRVFNSGIVKSPMADVCQSQGKRELKKEARKIRKDQAQGYFYPRGILFRLGSV
jgi:hypothetical protein